MTRKSTRPVGIYLQLVDTQKKVAIFRVKSGIGYCTAEMDRAALAVYHHRRQISYKGSRKEWRRNEGRKERANERTNEQLVQNGLSKTGTEKSLVAISPTGGWLAYKPFIFFFSLTVVLRAYEELQKGCIFLRKSVY